MNRAARVIRPPHMDEDRYKDSDDEERFERSRRRTAVAPIPPGNQQEHGGEICIREYLDSPVATSTAGTLEGARDRLAELLAFAGQLGSIRVAVPRGPPRPIGPVAQGSPGIGREPGRPTPHLPANLPK
jgi:hypothetical protein